MNNANYRMTGSETEYARPAGDYHKFDLAGLGPAPYSFVGVERKVCAGPNGSGHSSGAPGQPAGTCEFCGNGIAWCYSFRAANGNVFIVGSDCAMTAGDSGMRRIVKDQEARIRRAQNEKRADAKYARDMARIYAAWSRRDEVATELAAKPHPRGFINRETGAPMTLLDWADWMMANAGTAGRLNVAATIEKLGKEVA